MDHIIHIWERLTEPSPALEPSERYRARVLTGLLIFSLSLWVALLVVNILTLPSKNWVTGFIGGAVTAVILLSTYISRTTYYRLSAFSVIALLNFLVFATAIWQKNGVFLYLLILPVQLSTLYFSLRKTNLLIIANIIGFILLYVLESWFLRFDLFQTTLFLTIISWFILSISHYRNQLERDNQKGLAESRERYRTLLATSFDGIAMLQQGHIRIVNPGFLNLFGYDRDQAEQQPITKFVPEADRILTEVFVQGGVSPRETIGITQNGQPVDIELTARENIYLGEAVQLIAVRDISERKRAEKALRNSEARNQALLAAIPDTMFVFSRWNVCLDYRPTAVFANEIPFDSVINQPIEAIFPKNEAQKIQSYIEQLFSTQEIQRFECELRTTDLNRIFEVRLTLIAGLDQAMAILRDVTERKWAEATLLELSQELEMHVEARTAELIEAYDVIQKSESRWRSLVEFSPDIIATFDTDYCLTFINRDFLSFNAENAIGVSLKDLPFLDSTNQLLDALTRTIATSKMMRFELPLTLTASSMWFECRIAPILNQDELMTILLVATDITKQVLVKQELERRNQELAALNHVITAVSHSLGLTEIFNQLQEQLVAAQNVVGGGILLYHAENDTLSVQSEWGLPEGLLNRYHEVSADTFYYTAVIREIIPILTDDFRRIPELVTLGLDIARPGWQSHLCVPLVAKGEVQGVIGLFSEKPNMFNARQLEFFHSLGQQVGVAINNSRLFAAAQHARQIAETLQAANLALTGTLDLDRVLNTLLDYLQQLVPYDSANVQLRTADGVMQVFASRGYKQWPHALAAIKALSFDTLTFRTLQTIMETESSCLVEDVSERTDWVRVKWLDHMGSWLGVPLIAGGRVIGIYGLDKVAKNGFTSAHQRLAEALAAQAAVAVQNALLFDQVRTGREQLRILTQQVVMAQEDERLRVSRELHDEAGQALTALKISLALVLRGLPQPGEAIIDERSVRQDLESAVNLCERTMDQIRLLAHDLRPAALDDLGINPALEGFCDDFAERTSLIIRYFPGKEWVAEVPDAVGISLYRFLQEALTNVARHAEATEVDVRFFMTETAVSLSVADNGKGIALPLDDIIHDRNTGIGLGGIRERLQLLGGELKLETRSNHGAALIATIPLVENGRFTLYNKGITNE
jgi:PAS domain S-box-containing protein